MEELRRQIDSLDDELLIILSKRFAVVKKIGEFKKRNHLPALDQKRWREVLESKKGKGKMLGLSENFIENLYNLIHEYALALEEKIKL